MKTVLWLSFFVILVTAKKQTSKQDLLKKAHKECQSDPATKVDENLLSKFNVDDTLNVPNIGGYILCRNKKLNFQDQAGEINPNAIKEHLKCIIEGEKKISDIVSECTTKATGRANEEKALTLHKCIKDNSEEFDKEKIKKREEYIKKKVKDFLKSHKKCQSSPATALNKEELNQFKHEDNSDSPKLKAHVSCISRKLNIINKHGELNKQQIKKDAENIGVTAHKSEEIVQECSTKSPNDSPETTSYKAFQCLHKYWKKSKTFITAISASDRKDEFKKAFDECQSNPSTHVDEKILNKFRKGKDITDAQLKANINCLYLKVRIQNEDGSLNTDIIKTDLEFKIQNPDTVKKILEECAVQIIGDTPGDTAVKVFKCLNNRGEPEKPNENKHGNKQESKHNNKQGRGRDHHRH